MVESKIKTLIEKLKSSKFYKNVAVLMMGTGLSQVITIGVTVILARIYTTEQFGFFALFISIYSISGNPATLKYNKAILLPKDDDDSETLTIVSILTSIVYSAILFIIFFFFGDYIATKAGDAELSSWLLLMPAAIIFNSTADCLVFWLNRNKQYSTIATARVLKAITAAVFNIGLAYVLFSAAGLIIGEVVGVLALALFLLYKSRNHGLLKIPKFDFKRAKELVVHYKDFPKFNIPSDFINILASQLPLLLMTSFFGIHAAGLYSLTKRVMDAPVNLLSTAVMEVFRQRAVEEYNREGHCTPIFKKVFTSLFLLAIVPCIVIGLVAPSLFEIVFGSEWRQAGELASILMIMYFFKFIISPLTYVYFIFEKQKESFYLNVLLLLTAVTSLVVGYKLSNDLNTTILMFSIGYAGIYVLYGIRSFIISKGNA